MYNKAHQFQGQRLRSRGLSDRCWPISKERSRRYTKIGRKVARPTGTRFEVKRSRSWLINAETEIVSPTNFKLVRRLEHALSTAMASYKGLWSWVIAGGRGHTVSVTQLVLKIYRSLPYSDCSRFIDGVIIAFRSLSPSYVTELWNADSDGVVSPTAMPWT